MDDLENPHNDQRDGIERCCEPSPLINLNQQRPQNGHPESGFVAIGQNQVLISLHPYPSPLINLKQGRPRNGQPDIKDLTILASEQILTNPNKMVILASRILQS